MPQFSFSSLDHMLSSTKELMLLEAARPFYSTPTRQYHNWKHAKHVIQAVHAIVSRDESCCLVRPCELLIAAAWHDAVYVPGFSKNEEASAAAFRVAARDIYVPQDLDRYKLSDPTFSERTIVRLIESTHINFHMCTDAEAISTLSPDTFPLLDADLSSLAVPYEQFVSNQQSIMREQTGILYPRYKMYESARWLSGLLDRRENIFHTTIGRHLYERRARQNISKFIKENPVPKDEPAPKDPAASPPVLTTNGILVPVTHNVTRHILV